LGWSETWLYRQRGERKSVRQNRTVNYLPEWGERVDKKDLLPQKNGITARNLKKIELEKSLEPGCGKHLKKEGGNLSRGEETEVSQGATS